MEQLSGGECLSRPREYREISFSETDIEQSILSMDISTWISSMVEDILKDAKFDHHDFMGNGQSVVSVDDIVFSMLFYAFKMGKGSGDNKWEDECYSDFVKREKSFDRLLKKTENFCTKIGYKKISAVKREIRMRVETREFLRRGPLDSLGVFVEIPEMGSIISSTVPKEFVESLHRLGDFPESDPRYYIHTIYRYHMNDLHCILSDRDKVMRFPSIQKWMDIFHPVSSPMNLPPEFREFMKRAGGSKIPVVSLPVPSKTLSNTSVYGYNFESIPWVNVMRQEIFGKFSEWKNTKSLAYQEIYPEQLILGNPKNTAITEVLASCSDMSNLKMTYDSLELKQINMKTFLDIIALFPEVGNISRDYNTKVFISPGEQLRERRGFFAHSLVRGVFQRIAKKFPGFCNDVYSTLSIQTDTIDEFYDYCGSRKLKIFTESHADLWRLFLSALEKICLVFHVCSRVTEMEEFYAKYVTLDNFVKVMFPRAV